MAFDMYLMFYVMPSRAFRLNEYVIWDYLIKLLKLLACSDFSTIISQPDMQGNVGVCCICVRVHGFSIAWSTMDCCYGYEWWWLGLLPVSVLDWQSLIFVNMGLTVTRCIGTMSGNNQLSINETDKNCRRRVAKKICSRWVLKQTSSKSIKI